MEKKTKKPTTRKKKITGNDDMADLKKKIKHQKDALNKIIKTYSK